MNSLPLRLMHNESHSSRKIYFVAKPGLTKNLAFFYQMILEVIDVAVHFMDKALTPLHSTPLHVL